MSPVSLIISIISGAALLLFVLIISLIFIGSENAIFHVRENRDVPLLAPFGRFLSGRCSGGNCPPPCLYASCICLLLIFLFIPMGSLPQFVSTEADMIIILFLLLAAQSFYIRGMKRFSGALYQSLDRSEISLLFKFTVALLTAACSFSWYVLQRGIPGNIFCVETYAAMPIWNVAGVYGRLGLAAFFLLFAVTSPSRRAAKSADVGDNVPLPEIFDAVRSTICPAIIAAVFLPWRAGLSFGLTGLALYAADFALFWFKVFIIQILVIPPLRTLYLRVKSRLPEKLKLSLVIMLGVVGSGLMMADLYLL